MAFHLRDRAAGWASALGGVRGGLSAEPCTGARRCPARVGQGLQTAPAPWGPKVAPATGGHRGCTGSRAPAPRPQAGEGREGLLEGGLSPEAPAGMFALGPLTRGLSRARDSWMDHVSFEAICSAAGLGAPVVGQALCRRQQPAWPARLVGGAADPGRTLGQARVWCESGCPGSPHTQLHPAQPVFLHPLPGPCSEPLSPP